MALVGESAGFNRLNPIPASILFLSCGSAPQTASCVTSATPARLALVGVTVQ